MPKKIFHSGFVAILGRPNVGKSTLLNQILQYHLSITSHKPQTTRHRILGVKNTANTQVIYLDTPGLQQNFKQALHRYMNKTARAAVNDVDAVIFVIEANVWKAEDDYVLATLQNITIPIILVINKIDTIKDKVVLLPFLEKVNSKHSFHKVIPLSAKKNIQVSTLEESITPLLKTDFAYFDIQQITDRSDRFIAAELIREQLIRFLGQELPYATTVEIEKFEETESIIRIAAVIWVERQQQKSIVIGKKGQRLKEIGTNARLAMERLYAIKVYINVWVKVKEGWSNDERALQSLGYLDEN